MIGRKVKEQLIDKSFEKYNLTKEQKTHIMKILDGYIGLVESHKKEKLTPEEVQMYTDLVKTNIVNTLNILKLDESKK